MTIDKKLDEVIEELLTEADADIAEVCKEWRAAAKAEREAATELERLRYASRAQAMAFSFTAGCTITAITFLLSEYWG